MKMRLLLFEKVTVIPRFLRKFRGKTEKGKKKKR